MQARLDCAMQPLARTILTRGKVSWFRIELIVPMTILGLVLDPNPTHCQPSSTSALTPWGNRDSNPDMEVHSAGSPGDSQATLTTDCE